MGRFKNILGQKGVGLAELLMATAILSIVSVSIVSYVVTQNQNNLKIQGASDCRSEVESILKDFTNTSGTLIYNNIPGSADLVGGSTNRNIASERGNQDFTYYDANSLSNASASYQNYYNFQNIENGMTRALQLYYTTPARSGPSDSTTNSAICTNSQAVTAGMLSNTVALTNLTTKGYTASVQIIPYDFITQVNLVCSTPLSGLRPTKIKQPWENDVNSGLRVKVTVTKTADATATCSGEGFVKYNADLNPPTISMISENPNWNNAAVRSCLTNDYDLQVQSSEPGSVFECSFDNATWFLCPSSTVANNWASVVSAQLPPSAQFSMNIANRSIASQGTEVRAIFTNLPTTFNKTFYVRSVDSASNNSGVSTTVRNIQCPCTHTDYGYTCKVDSHFYQDKGGCYFPPNIGPAVAADSTYTWSIVGDRRWERDAGGSIYCSDIGPATGVGSIAELPAGYHCRGAKTCTTGVSTSCYYNSLGPGYTNTDYIIKNDIWGKPTQCVTCIYPGTTTCSGTDLYLTSSNGCPDKLQQASSPSCAPSCSDIGAPYCSGPDLVQNNTCGAYVSIANHPGCASCTPGPLSPDPDAWAAIHCDSETLSYSDGCTNYSRAGSMTSGTSASGIACSVCTWTPTGIDPATVCSNTTYVTENSSCGTQHTASGTKSPNWVADPTWVPGDHCTTEYQTETDSSGCSTPATRNTASTGTQDCSASNPCSCYDVPNGFNILWTSGTCWMRRYDGTGPLIDLGPECSTP